MSSSDRRAVSISTAAPKGGVWREQERLGEAVRQIVEAAVAAALHGKVTIDGASLTLKRDNTHALIFTSR